MFPHTEPLPLRGRTALVTGVSRRRGIGFAVARQFARLGADVFIHHYSPHDDDQPWGSDDLDAVRAGLRAELTPGAQLGDIGADLRDAASVPVVIEAARALTGRLDVLVCNHALSGGDGSILDMTAERLDAFWQTNARSTILLTREFAALHGGESAGSRPGERIERKGPFTQPTGRVFWMTSGQIHGPMPGEVAYAASKAVLAGLTTTVGAELLTLGIILNTIDPGPVNTGYLDPETTDRPLEEIEAWMRATPFGRYGEPDDPARLIGWLATDAGAWVVGQVLTTDGGLRLA
ncbi:SDR family oxidoreductase [Microbacterium cremeum]|uniref:SDR family oxidoreductase n=1 Tax=Microbacterium cremeum TaxID=2782169 RepID=UPI00188728A6|nr:SDR family oxidoreductase [Microbacterium cremeum]